MRRKGLWLSVLATAMVAGNVSADVSNNAGVYTYEGNNFNFFTYNTNNDPNNPNDGVGLSSATWNYGQVTETSGTFSNNVHFQQYDPLSTIELMDGNYTHGATSALPPSGGPYTLGDPRYALQSQIWDNEQLFWNFNSNSSILNIGIVTGFQSEGRDGYGAGDLFLRFGTDTINLPNTSETGGATGSGGFYDLAIGTGDNRNTGSSEWVLGDTWVDQDSSPFYIESDPYRYTSGGTAVDIANVEWTDQTSPSTLNVSRNVHNFLAVAINLSGHQDWIDSLLGDIGGYGGFTTHWTYGCGNDTIHYTSITPGTQAPPPVPVPAAAPLGLLGMGLLGLVRRLRRRPAC